MKDYLAELVHTAADPLAGQQVAREYLQARILSGLQRAGAFVTLAFHGGTALRFLYQIPRYSEDLDFALEGKPDEYDLRAYLKAVRSDLTAEGYPVEIRVQDDKTVHNARVRFSGLLHELGLSPHAGQVLMVKVEVDTNPPAGAHTTTTIVRRHVVLHLQHHDRPSLLAGKLHAILQRPYTKGRDVFDLHWYLANPDWPAPNLTLLNNALAQSGWTGRSPGADNWREVVWQRLAGIDWDSAMNDIRPFMMDPHSADSLTKDSLRQQLAAAPPGS